MKSFASEFSSNDRPDAYPLSHGLTDERVRTEDATVRLYRDSDKCSWNKFVREHPDGTAYHLAEWREVLHRAFDHRTHYLLVERRGAIRGILPLAETKSLLFGHALVSTPFCMYGGILAIDDDAHAVLERAACDLARRLQVDYIEMRDRKRRHPQWPYKDLYVTFRKEISDDAEKNMLAIPRKQRAMVRKGIKMGLRAEVDEHVDRHYNMYSESLRNLGTPVFSKRFVEALKESFGDACDIVTIFNGDRPVASVLNLYFRDEVLAYCGGGTQEARAVAGNDFMYWEVMERARQRGCRIFDYGRSKRGSGAFDFKTYWGFEPEPLYYEYYLVNRKDVPNLSPANPKYRGVIDLWRRLPLRLTQLLGPVLAKHLN